MAKSKRMDAFKPTLAAQMRRLDADFRKSSADLPDLEHDLEFLVLVMRGELINQVEKALAEEGITRADLARTMGVSRAYISKILNEKSNFQLETIARIAMALNRDIDLRLIRKDERVIVQSARSAPKKVKQPGIAAVVSAGSRVIQATPNKGKRSRANE